MYYQCRLEQTRGCATTVTTGWVEERGAKKDATIELLPKRDLWEVAEVYGHAIPENLLKEHQRLNRGSLPSIERMR